MLWLHIFVVTDFIATGNSKKKKQNILNYGSGGEDGDDDTCSEKDVLGDEKDVPCDTYEKNDKGIWCIMWKT